ncbi:hypothetical protein ACFP3I_21230 [Chryseobacterium arachidis]
MTFVGKTSIFIYKKGLYFYKPLFMAISGICIVYSKVTKTKQNINPKI